MNTSGKNRGFTLVEMLVSLAIFAVITAFTTANFSVAKQGDELRLASQLLASSLRRAQSAATSGETVQVCHGGVNDLKLCMTGVAEECPGGSCSQEVPFGYGVRVMSSGADTKKATFFADINNNRAFDVGEAIRSESVSPGAFVSVSSATPNNSGVLDIVFIPPKPTTYYNGAVDTAIADIVLRHSTTTQQKTVTINRLSGQISAQ